MTVLLVIATFAVFILIDSLLVRRATVRKLAEAALHAAPEPVVGRNRCG